MEYSKIAKRIISEQADALSTLSRNIPDTFNAVVQHILNNQHRIILTGMGKSGYIARKIAASFSSTGTAAFYIHPSEASHGDLGMITENDIVIMLSTSGETRELFDVIRYCKRFGIMIVAITMNAESELGRNADFILQIPNYKEASTILAPTTSALMMLSLGDSLTIAVQEAKGFSKEDFGIYHPGGKLGASLKQVSELMYTGNRLPLIDPESDLQKVIDVMTSHAFGCAIVVDKHNKLIGIITDGDLRRNIHNAIHLKYASDFMTQNPQSLKATKLAAHAIHLMNNKTITAIPVVDDENKVIGLIHIHDLLRAGC